MIWSEFITMEL